MTGVSKLLKHKALHQVTFIVSTAACAVLNKAIYKTWWIPIKHKFCSIVDNIINKWLSFTCYHEEDSGLLHHVAADNKHGTFPSLVLGHIFHMD